MNHFYAFLIGALGLAVATLVANQMVGEKGAVVPPPAASNTASIAPTTAPTAPVSSTAPAASTASPVTGTTTAAKPSPVATQAPPSDTVAAPPLTLPMVSADLVAGKKIYIASCFVCHETGANGAPKRGDASAWQARLTQGTDQLIAHVMNGFNAMPPRGGNPNLTEEEVATVIPYLASGAE